MDITLSSGTVRGLITAALILLFIALFIWAYSSKRRATFDAASRLPLEDDRKDAP